ncbi:transportin-3-like isoform X3 [Bolinopsis microptera]|uniref:transportin-3-like isoform X1 n=1 Tax=Bolinopsis microptera TaxID=2820187 RepID=UPI003078B1CA
MAGEGKPQLHEVYAALSVLYDTQNRDKLGVEKASTYLSHIQQSVWAWELADTLLIQNKGKENNNFAATMLRNKIQKEFRELPENSHASLRDSLLKHLDLYREGDAVLVTKLSLAVADLALQMVSWKNVVNDLVARFSQDSKSWTVLLECLTVLPEEVGSRYLKLGAARREEVTTQLQACSATVFSFLEFVSANSASLPNPDFTHNHVFRCWGSWLVLGEFDARAVAQGKILPKIFEIVTVNTPCHTCYDSACDAVCSATYAMEDLHVNRELALQIVPRLAALQPTLVNAINTDNLDVVNSITRIVTEAGESLISPLTKTPGKDLGDLSVVSTILAAIQFPDYSVAESSFSFWFQLAENIYRAPDMEIVETYKPVFIQLLNTLVKLCELYDEFEESSFDDEDFLDFRDKCSDLFKDIVYIVGIRPVLELLLAGVEQTPPDQWQRLESMLFCSSCVIKILSRADSDIVMRYLKAALGIPTTANQNLRVMSVKVLGECAEWVTIEQQVLNHVLQKLLQELRDKKLASHCIKTLEKLCQMGGEVLQSHLELLIQIIEQAEEVPHSTFTAFIECVAGICSYQPLALQSPHLMRIANRSLLSLAKNPADPVKDIDNISSIFRGYKGEVAPTDESPLQAVFVATWPHLSVALLSCANSVNNIERVCRCIRYGLRSVGKKTPQILEPLAEKLIQLYNIKPHSCVLYLSSVIVDEFSSDVRLEEGLLGLFSAMGPKTFEILSAPHGLERNPDTVDDFYRLCSRYIQHVGSRVVSSPIMIHLVDIATNCLSLQHKDAQCSAIKFMDTLMQRANNEKCPHSLGQIKRKGQDMVNSIVLGVSGGLPPSLLTDLCILLHDLLAALGEEARAWLRLALGTIPLGAYVTQKQVEELYHNVTASTTLPRDTVRYCKEFNQCFS